MEVVCRDTYILEVICGPNVDVVVVVDATVLDMLESIVDSSPVVTVERVGVV